MLKKASVFLVPVLVFQLTGIPIYAQTQGAPNHFDSERACQDAVASGNFQFYRASILKRIAQRSNEVVIAHPTGGCFLMGVPENIGGKQWVPIESGRLFVYDKSTRGVLRLEECDNTIYAESPFGGVRPESNPFTANRTDVVVQAPSIREAVSRVEFTPLPAQQTRTDINVDVDRGGLSKWIKWPLIVGGAALVAWGAYEIYEHFRDTDNRSAPEACQVVIIGATTASVTGHCDVTAGR